MCNWFQIDRTSRSGVMVHLRKNLIYIYIYIQTRAELVRAIVWARVRAGVGSELGVSKKFLSASGPSWGTQGVGGSKNMFIK